MFQFDKRVRPLVLPGLGLRLVDLLEYEYEIQQQIIAEFDEVFNETFLNPKFPGEQLCRNNDHLKDLFNAYIEYDYAEQAVGRVAVSLEEWAVDNGAQHVASHVTLPHQGVRWFEIQSTRTGHRAGALQISQIDLIDIVDHQADLRGHAIMTLPKHETLSYAQHWGTVLKTLLDLPFIDAENPNAKARFEEWALPTGPESRYVARPGNSFGKDVTDQASAGIRTERGGADIGLAPLTLRKRERFTEPTAGELDGKRGADVALVRGGNR